MNIYNVLFFLLYIILTHLIARFIGSKRKIGYGKSVFWSVLFSPAIGLIITLLSKPIVVKH